MKQRKILIRSKFWKVKFGMSCGTIVVTNLYVSRDRVAPKKLAQFLYALTLSNINRFSKLFHCQNQEKKCNNTITKDSTIRQVCCYTTL